MGKPYEIHKDAAKKELLLVVGGVIKEEIVKQFMKELETALAGINTAEYTLNLDAKTFPVQAPDALEGLKKVLQYYESLGFKQIIVQKGPSAVAGMQINRITRELKMQNVKVI